MVQAATPRRQEEKEGRKEHKKERKEEGREEGKKEGKRQLIGPGGGTLCGPNEWPTMASWATR